MTLEDYFKLIVNKPAEKEPTMFDVLKAKWTEFWNFGYTWIEPEEEKSYEEGWAFVMRTDSYVNEDGEFIPMKETIIQGDNNGTWMESLDQLLDVFSKHYGYDIKEQVYYSVFMPMNIEGKTGYGRSLNDEVLQQLLLAYPEVYDWQGHKEFKL
jgi:hypothetical protein